jgi:hypothetical protein
MLARRIAAGFVVGLLAIFGFAGCDKKVGDAIILSKEHIAAKISATPGEPSSSAAASTSTASESQGDAEETATGLAGGTIAVGPYIMKPEVRGTSRDPRAINHEQWLVTVKMIHDLRLIDVHADQAQFQKLKEGDRVKVTYKMGKYTGTVWDAEIR